MEKVNLNEIYVLKKKKTALDGWRVQGKRQNSEPLGKAKGGADLRNNTVELRSTAEAGWEGKWTEVINLRLLSYQKKKKIQIQREINPKAG